MQTIISLNYSHLKNPQHFNVMDFTKAAITKYNLAEGKYSKYVTRFLEAFAAEDEAYQKYDRKTLSKRIADQNVARQMKFRLLRDILDVFRVTGDEQKRLAASRLLGAIDLYGGGVKIPALPMDSLTGVLTNLIEDFTDKYADDVELLEIGDAVANLRAENEAFKQLISLRTQTDSELGKKAMANARAESDKTLRMLFTAINLDVEYGDAEATLEPFIAYMNTEIERYRIQIGQGSGTASSDSETGSDEVAAVMKNATFKFIGGRTEIIPVEVGTVLIPPTNTEGYKWKPAVPELMPKTNKTFSEVPIEDREVTLTFHFLSHDDELLRGIVGSELTAPQNTDGCHWEPTVPSVFPEQDMTFNEVLDEPAGGEGGEPTTPNEPSNPGGTGEGEPLYTIAWYDKSTPIQWYELPAGAPVPEAPEPPAGHRWAQTFTVMPARDVDIVAVAI